MVNYSIARESERLDHKGIPVAQDKLALSRDSQPSTDRLIIKHAKRDLSRISFETNEEGLGEERHNRSMRIWQFLVSSTSVRRQIGEQATVLVPVTITQYIVASSLEFRHALAVKAWQVILYSACLGDETLPGKTSINANDFDWKGILFVLKLE